MDKKPVLSTRNTRDSGIESLKILAMFIIVISHTVLRLSDSQNNLGTADWYNVAHATTDVKTVILLIFRHFGVLGNSIFFICSAWFLLKSPGCEKRKWFFMLIEIWTVSLIILFIAFPILHGGISNGIMIKSLFPTLFANNWYMTCYLLFYPIHPFLNWVIKRMDQVMLFRATGGLALLYIGFSFINKDFFFPSRLILWVTLYFVVAYMRSYLGDFSDNTAENLVMFGAGAAGFIGMTLATEVLGLHMAFMSEKMLYWARGCNPFLLCMSLAMFNIARNICFRNKFVNYISSLSLLIYIIHDNLILRTYFWPAVWRHIYKTYRYSNIIAWVFLLAVLLFLFGTIFAIIYERILQNLIKRASNSLYDKLKVRYLSLEAELLKIH